MSELRLTPPPEVVVAAATVQDENRSPIITTTTTTTTTNQQLRSILKTPESKLKRELKPSNIRWSRYSRIKKLKSDGSLCHKNLIEFIHSDEEAAYETVDDDDAQLKDEQIELDEVDVEVGALVNEMIDDVESKAKSEMELMLTQRRFVCWHRMLTFYNKENASDHETLIKTALNVFNIDPSRIDFAKLINPETPDAEIAAMVGDELVADQVIMMLKNLHHSTHYRSRLMAIQNLFQTFENFELEPVTIRKSINEKLFRSILYENDPNEVKGKLNIRIQSHTPQQMVLRYLWSTLEVKITFGSDGDKDKIVDIEMTKLVNNETNLSSIRWILAGKIDPPLYDGDLKTWVFKDCELDIFLAALDQIKYRFDALKTSLLLCYTSRGQESELITQLDELVRPGVSLAKELLFIRSTERCRINRHSKSQFFLTVKFWPRCRSCDVKFKINPITYPSPDSIAYVICLSRRDKPALGEILSNLDELLTQLKKGQPNCLIRMLQAMRAFFDEIFDRREQFDDSRSPNLFGQADFDQRMMSMIEEFHLSSLRFRVQPFDNKCLSFRFLWSTYEVNVFTKEDKLDISTRRLALNETHMQQFTWTIEGRQGAPLFDSEDQRWMFQASELPILVATTYRIDVIFRRLSHNASWNIQELCHALHLITESAREMCLELLEINAREFCHIQQFPPSGIFQMQIEVWGITTLALVEIEFEPLHYPFKHISPTILLGPGDESLQPKMDQLKLTLASGLAVSPGRPRYLSSLLQMIHLYLNELRSKPELNPI